MALNHPDFAAQALYSLQDSVLGGTRELSRISVEFVRGVAAAAPVPVSAPGTVSLLLLAGVASLATLALRRR